MIISRAMASDWPFIHDLGRRVSAASASPLRPADHVAAAYTALLDYIQTREHLALVALDADRPVGFALVLFDIPDEVTLTPQAFLAYMAVEPAFQRQGAGRALLDAAEGEARTRSLPYLSLMVTEGNPAGELYATAGFAPERRMMTKVL